MSVNKTFASVIQEYNELPAMQMTHLENMHTIRAQSSAIYFFSGYPQRLTVQMFINFRVYWKDMVHFYSKPKVSDSCQDAWTYQESL
jgi:hypothetical protein